MTLKNCFTFSGEASEREVLTQFLDAFGHKLSSEADIPWSQFEQYYEGLSLGIESDSDFENILKNAWSI